MKVLELMKRSRSLRLMLCAFMVPLMVITSGSGARAAATSEARIFTLEMPRSPDIACGVVYSIGGGLGGGTFQVQSGGWCEQKSIPEWGAPDITSTEFSITVKGMHEDGAPTEWNLSWSVVGHEDGFFSDKALMGTPSAPVAAGWDLHEVCVKAVDRFGFDTWAEDCQASSLASPDGGATCDLAELTSVERTQPYVADWGSDLSRGWVFDGVFTYTLAGSEAPRVNEWAVYYLLRHNNGELSRVIKFPLVASDAGAQMSGPEVLGPRQFWSGPASPMDREVIGVGLAHIGAFDVFNQRSAIRETGGDSEARVGVHDPSRCLLYMGEKVWDDGQPGGTDEPTMPLPPAEGDEEVPPEVPDVPESPSGEDPWWMSLLGLLRKIINAITSLPAKIVDLLGDSLRALFIPDEWPDWSGVGVDLPSGWVPELPSLGSGACGPIVMPKMNFGMAGQVGGYPFVDTCEAPWTHVRTVTYFGLLALALIVVAKRIFNAAMGGVGMSVESGGGGDDL